ncbi:asparaginase [Arcticibacterium luteifluviistationis]|uniref:asparaginase n=1 Tax=Arcticibacterium luteifluviistationis TaxID=1784714 RepID=A0A2Z4GAM5_9BACT|nr:asparaginase [Arcticibacterium luteifluviistationis]AWV98194.1 L-asparaginase 1 [Arcticibacterium luteifluviistationis]
MVVYNTFKIDTDIQGKTDVSKVLMIYTGGTLGMVYDKVKKTLVPLKFEEIQKNIPELERFESELTIIPIEPPIDSSNMSPAVWIELAALIAEQYERYDGFVILHGTDTMAHTASALSFLLENLAKPVILTGAQLPIGVTRTDARENMMTALELAADKVDGETILHEVCIYFNGRLLRGNRAKKYESSQFDAFQSENYPMLAEVGIYCVYNRPYMLPKPEGEFTSYAALNTDVLILKLFPGISNAFVKQILATENLEAVVLETYGSGNASSDEGFLRLLKEASKNGIIIYNVSQCSGGEVRQGDYDTGKGLQNAGVISGKDITTEAAVCKLMYLLAMGNPISETKRLLQENLRGEVVD